MSQYRYLWPCRENHEPLGKCGRTLCFIMLNPSTGTDSEDDRTIQKCKKFAKYWDYKHMRIVNLYAARATNPKDLRTMVINPVGEGDKNDEMIRQVLSDLKSGDRVVCAWGGTNVRNKGTRIKKVHEMLLRDCQATEICALKINRNGSPRHPLYVSQDVAVLDYPIPQDRKRL